MTERSIGRPSSGVNLIDPAFPTRRAIVGGAVITGVVSALSYRPTPDPPWTPITTSAIWLSRESAGFHTHNDRLWLFGGSAPRQGLDLGDAWSTVDGIDWRKELMSPIGRPIKIANSLDDRTGEPISELLG
jgi:hypothetical protein